jgi:hypothetical protein
MSNVQKILDAKKEAARKKKAAADLKANQGPKADMRAERKKGMTKAFKTRHPNVSKRVKKIADKVIDKSSARTRPELIASSQRAVKKNPKLAKYNMQTLTEKGYEDLPPLPKDRKLWDKKPKPERHYATSFSKGSTVRKASGGPVVDSYDYD